MIRGVTIIAVAAALAASCVSSSAQEWQPRGIRPTAAVIGDVLVANARASGRDDPRLAERYERWTYVSQRRSIPVRVAVRDDDFRTDIELDGLTYEAGRRNGARWRSDGNGVPRGVQADLQGDPLDRAPAALFRIDPATCTLVGEADIPAATWVVQTHREGDKSSFLYIEAATGLVLREVMRDGKSVITTTFDRFERIDDTMRARHWIVEDGQHDDRIDVTVDAIDPGTVALADIALPQRRIFAPRTALTTSIDLPASFDRGMIFVNVSVGGKPQKYVLDTGTPSITVRAM